MLDQNYTQLGSAGAKIFGSPIGLLLRPRQFSYLLFPGMNTWLLDYIDLGDSRGAGIHMIMN